MTSAVLASEAVHASSSLSPIVVGLIAFGVLLFLLGVTWTFRNYGNRH